MAESLFDSALIQALTEPFHPLFVEWKPQATTKDGTRALAAAYVDARHYQHRLDTLAPGWETEYEFIKPDGSLVKCRLTINGVTREEVGESDPDENNTATSAVAQSFKRACAAFGLGRYLYFLPQVWSEYDPKSRRITTPPALPGWAKPGGSGYPLSDGERSARAERSEHTGTNGTNGAHGANGTNGVEKPVRARKSAAAQKDQPAEAAVEQPIPAAPADPEAAPAPVETPYTMNREEAASVVFSLRPKTRPELSGKMLGEVAEVAPDILVWLAEQYTPTPETEQLKEAARVLNQ